MSYVVAVSANQSSIQDTIVMNQDTDMKYLDTNMDPTDGCLAKDKWDSIQAGLMSIRMGIMLHRTTPTYASQDAWQTAKKSTRRCFNQMT